MPPLPGPPARPLRVTVDVSPAVHRRAGLGRYAAELVHALAEEGGAGLHLRAFFAESRSARPEGLLAALPHASTPLGYKPWRLAAMLSHFSRAPLDRLYGSPAVLHATDHLLPHVRAATLFTLHDLIFEIYPEHHKRYNHAFLTLMMPRFLRAADHIVCVSEQTRRDAERLYGVDSAKMTVIYEAADPRYRPVRDEATRAAVRARYDLPPRFLLHVGTLEPRKNLGLLLEILPALRETVPDLGLVLVGRKGWLYEPFFAQLAASGLGRAVHFPGFVADEDLPTLYSLADAFVFPSVYEGFGLPPLEALACGVPTACSHASSLPEVVGDAALLLDPHAPAAWLAALRRLLSDGTLRRELAARGPSQAARFSWQRAAQQTLALYARLADAPRT